MNPRQTKPRGRPAASMHPEMREQLLDSAITLFAAKGVAATSMARIAQAVGVTPAMVHYYFKSREQLLDAVADERIMRFIGHVLGVSPEGMPPGREKTPPVFLPGDSLPGRIQGVVTRIMEGANRMPWMPPLWIREVLAEGGELRERVLARIPFAALQEFAEEIRAGQERHEINPGIDPRLIVLSILGVTLLPLATQSFWSGIPMLAGLSPDQVAKHAATLLLQGLCPQPRQEGAPPATGQPQATRKEP